MPDDATWKPTPEARRRATTLRIIAWVLWVLAIAGEAVGIFWLLRQREPSEIVHDEATGVLVATEDVFPQWALIVLIVLIVVIGVLAVGGSVLWKRANRLDPASKRDAVRFFLQNQLGAIVTVVAFLPLVVLIFTNKDMSAGQKALAGTVGVVVAAVAVVLGIDFDPPSVERYTAERSTVVQLLGQDRVFWVEGGGVYHVCPEVSDIRNATTAPGDGTTAQAVEAGKSRLTLELESELHACGLPVPENIDAIVDAIRAIQGGATETRLPAPVYADGVTPPFQPALAGV